jgi:hypothetical protein
MSILLFLLVYGVCAVVAKRMICLAGWVLLSK